MNAGAGGREPDRPPMHRAPVRFPAWKICACLWASAASLGTAPAATAATAGWHEFTDTSGRTLLGEIMEANDTTVRVRRDDGQVFDLPLETLSAADRTHVDAWRTRRDFAFGGIEVSAHRVRLEVERVESRSRIRKTEDWCYKLAIANRSKADLTGLTVEYRIFFVDDTPHADRDELPLQRESGRIPLGVLAAGTVTEVQTTVATLELEQAKPGSRTRKRGKRRVEDALAGVWVRVMREGAILHEFADPTTLPRTESW